MAITISNGPLTIGVIAILGWSTTRASGNILHEVIGRGDHDVTLGDLKPRAGSFTALVASLAGAVSVETYFATNGVHTLTDDESPEIGMSFVLQGSVDVTLDPETLRFATVTIGFQQVSA